MFFSRRAAALLTSGGGRAAAAWRVARRAATTGSDGKPTNQHTRAANVDASQLNLSLDEVPQLKIVDEARQFAQEERWLRDPSEVSGIDENLPAEADDIPFDPTKTELPEDEDIKEEHMAPDIDRDVNPREALAHLSLAVTVLLAAVAAIWYSDPAGPSSALLGPRDVPVDIVWRAAGGDVDVPAKFRNGPPTITPMAWGPTPPVDVFKEIKEQQKQLQQ